jgi:hypothetical protein
VSAAASDLALLDPTGFHWPSAITTRFLGIQRDNVRFLLRTAGADGRKSPVDTPHNPVFGRPASGTALGLRS